jgi:hypothetical protein
MQRDDGTRWRIVMACARDVVSSAFGGTYTRAQAEAICLCDEYRAEQVKPKRYRVVNGGDVVSVAYKTKEEADGYAEGLRDAIRVEEVDGS